jgi:hypothetical protein
MRILNIQTNDIRISVNSSPMFGPTRWWTLEIGSTCQASALTTRVKEVSKIADTILTLLLGSRRKTDFSRYSERTSVENRDSSDVWEITNTVYFEHLTWTLSLTEQSLQEIFKAANMGLKNTPSSTLSK